MKQLVYLIGLLLFPMLCQSQVPEVERQIDHFLQEHAGAGKFNGHLLVAKDGKKVYDKAFGFADLTEQTKLTATSVYGLASVSKIFTSAAIVQLIQERKASLEGGIRAYIPELPGVFEEACFSALWDEGQLCSFKAGGKSRGAGGKILCKRPAGGLATLYLWCRRNLCHC